MENREHPAYRILLSDGEGEIIEKKSRFIATVRSVATEEEAAAFIEEMKKKYWDARHNCSAFVIGERGEKTRCSDDGEPSGTAGKPMLEVLTGSGIKNIAVVVTRYFGGVLLGTGGLVRAYTQATQAGISNCQTGVMKYGVRLGIVTDYNGIGKIQYILGQKGIDIVNAVYTEKVEIEMVLAKELQEMLCKEITEATAGKAEISILDEMYFVDKVKND